MEKEDIGSKEGDAGNVDAVNMGTISQLKSRTQFLKGPTDILMRRLSQNPLGEVFELKALMSKKDDDLLCKCTFVGKLYICDHRTKPNPSIAYLNSSNEFYFSNSYLTCNKQA